MVKRWTGSGQLCHYAGDFLVGSGVPYQGTLLNCFTALCRDYGAPLAAEKNNPSYYSAHTSWDGNIDSTTQLVTILQDKVRQITQAISAAKQLSKILLESLQSLSGLLTFISWVVVPGCAFLRRLINLIKGLKRKNKPYQGKILPRSM